MKYLSFLGFLWLFCLYILVVDRCRITRRGKHQAVNFSMLAEEGFSEQALDLVDEPQELVGVHAFTGVAHPIDSLDEPLTTLNHPRECLLRVIYVMVYLPLHRDLLHFIFVSVMRVECASQTHQLMILLAVKLHSHSFVLFTRDVAVICSLISFTDLVQHFISQVCLLIASWTLYVFIFTV